MELTLFSNEIKINCSIHMHLFEKKIRGNRGTKLALFEPLESGDQGTVSSTLTATFELLDFSFTVLEQGIPIFSVLAPDS